MYGQPQQPGQQLTVVHHGQSASVSWQDQVRGNPAAEYAALMQARTAEEAGAGAAPMPAQLSGMQQMGINQARMDGRGLVVIQAWLTGSLHEGGIRSARSPLRRAPLLATPIAMPLQFGRP